MNQYQLVSYLHLHKMKQLFSNESAPIPQQHVSSCDWLCPVLPHTVLPRSSLLVSVLRESQGTIESGVPPWSVVLIVVVLFACGAMVSLTFLLSYSLQVRCCVNGCCLALCYVFVPVHCWDWIDCTCMGPSQSWYNNWLSLEPIYSMR